MQTVSVGIIGLKRMGGSFGLAMRRYNQSKEARQQFFVTGYDPDDRNAAKAKTLGAVDNTARSMVSAARDKDVVILALPYHEIEAAYQSIGRDLRDGAVLLDTSPYQQPSVIWASKYCGKEVYLVGMTPVINVRYLVDGLDDLEHAAEDFFDKGVMLVSPSTTADRDAVQLATDLAQLLGASVRYTDPAEHDSWMVVTEALPAAIGVAAFHAISGQDHWDDVRRVGNSSFGQLTHHLLEAHPDSMRDLIMRDRESLIRHIDSITRSLDSLRSLLVANDRDAVEALLIQSRDSYTEWLARRRTGEWDPSHKMERESAGESIMTGLFGGAIAKRLKRGGDDDG